jgi:hypothetical protein
MANFEGIRFPSPTQSLARSPKLCFYESLLAWNQGVDQLVATLRGMEKFPFARKTPLQCAQAEIEEVRSDVNADFMEQLAECELKDAGRFWKQRRAYERKREDPDDVYFEVQHREEERKKQGLPPRLGIVPNSALADEEKRIEKERSNTAGSEGRCKTSRVRSETRAMTKKRALGRKRAPR